MKKKTKSLIQKSKKEQSEYRSLRAKLEKFHTQAKGEKLPTTEYSIEELKHIEFVIGLLSECEEALESNIDDLTGEIEE